MITSKTKNKFYGIGLTLVIVTVFGGLLWMIESQVTHYKYNAIFNGDVYVKVITNKKLHTVDVNSRVPHVSNTVISQSSNSPYEVTATDRMCIYYTDAKSSSTSLAKCWYAQPREATAEEIAIWNKYK